MQPIGELVAELARLGVRLWTQRGELRFSGPPDATKHPAFSALRDRKLEAITFLDARSGAPARPHVVPVERPKHLALSQTQQTIWQLGVVKNELQGQVTIELLLPTQPHVEVWEHALNCLIRRHEILRTVYRDGPNGIEQVVLDDLPVTINVANLDHLSKESAGKFVDDELRPAFRDEQIDLENGPMVLAQIFVIAEANILLLSFHQLAVDVYSQPMLLRELISFYQATRAKVEPTTPTLTVQYADFTLWEHALLDAGNNEHASYWSSRLADVPPASLGTGQRMAPPFRAGMKRIAFPQPVVIATRSAAIQAGVDLELFLIAAANVLVSAWSKQPRAAVGLLVAGRPPGAERSIGAFAHIRPFILDLSEDLPFEKVLWQARAEHLATMNAKYVVTHREVASHKLHRVFFSVTKVSNEGPNLSPAVPDVPVQALRGADYFHHFVLTLTLHASGIRGRLDYAEGVIDESKAEWFAQELPAFLMRVSKNIRLSLSEAVESAGGNGESRIESQIQGDLLGGV